ncbi:MAG: hypothetical protein LBJ02_05130 [Bifidobacteriaceae bacterium]|jgi:hypothetical protein|nr:hypothetical protein [Bifidobacteriaceae bacterium]
MSLYLVSKVKANDSADGARPATGADARAKLSPEEREAAITLPVREVHVANRCGAGRELQEMTEAKALRVELTDARWEATFTPTRLILWSPFTMRVFGKAKVKPGRALAGQIMYEWFDEMSLNGSGFMLEFAPHPDDYVTWHGLELFFGSSEQAAEFTAALADRLERFHRGQGNGEETLFTELARLRALDWSSREHTEFNLMKAGAKVKYTDS